MSRRREAIHPRAVDHACAPQAFLASRDSRRLELSIEYKPGGRLTAVAVEYQTCHSVFTRELSGCLRPQSKSLSLHVAHNAVLGGNNLDDNVRRDVDPIAPGQKREGRLGE